MKGKVRDQRKTMADKREGEARSGGWAGMQVGMQASARLKIQQN
jgi:hypothetical protein